MNRPRASFIARNVVVGALVGLIGLALGLGGTWLVSRSGSWYDLPVG